LLNLQLFKGFQNVSFHGSCSVIKGTVKDKYSDATVPKTKENKEIIDEKTRVTSSHEIPHSVTTTANTN